jgi:hypothetical protein
LASSRVKLSGYATNTSSFRGLSPGNSLRTSPCSHLQRIHFRALEQICRVSVVAAAALNSLLLPSGT